MVTSSINSLICIASRKRLTFSAFSSLSLAVFIHPSGNCSQTNAKLVGYSSPASYTFTWKDIGTKTFACDAAWGFHCTMGQLIEFTVSKRTEQRTCGAKNAVCNVKADCCSSTCIWNTNKCD
jgi:hypothetical protein